MAYPSTITTLTNPQPTDRLNSPSHSSVETNQNTAITELQTFLGTLSSAVGTILYDVRAAASDGGGHVQGVNKGGTGQTAYTKGDVLVATSASALAKFGVGADNQQIRANSSVAAGMEWFTPTSSSNKIATNASFITISSTAAETSLFSVSVPGSTLGTSNAVRATLFVSDFATDGASSVLLRANYGGTTIASVLFTGAMAVSAGSVAGRMSLDILANATTTAQKGVFRIDLAKETLFLGSLSNSSIITATRFGSASEDSSANKTIGMTVKFPDADFDTISIQGYEIEKIT